MYAIIIITGRFYHVEKYPMISTPRNPYRANAQSQSLCSRDYGFQILDTVKLRRVTPDILHQYRVWPDPRAPTL